MKQLILIILLIVPFNFSLAQINPLPNGPSISIEIKDSYFKPFTKNTASLNDYSFTEPISNIFWRIDGKTLSESTNKRSIDFTTKDVGEPTTVEVVIETASKKTVAAKKVINPIYLDVIVEPQTRTPSFYKGRALPTVHSHLNLTALINGSVANSSNYIFNWSVNNVFVQSGPVRGNYKIDTTLPIGGYAIVTLKVSTLDGQVVAGRNIEISPSEQEVLFYEVNSLYGISNIPIKNSLNLIGNSSIVRAEPYYLDLNTYNKPQLLEWKIDGQKSSRPESNPYEVTLARPEISGVSYVSFHVRNLSVILQGVKGDFKVRF